MKHPANRSSPYPSGITLLELTIVIVVLLTLISVLFMGARAWKRGSDRSNNILNIRNVQQAVRGHQNIRNMNPGDPLAHGNVLGSDSYLKTPSPPAGLEPYTYVEAVPPTGTLYVTNHFDHEIYGFKDSSEYSNW